MSECLSLLQNKSRFVCGIWGAGCRRISLRTICRTVRDGADDFGDSQKKKFLREVNKGRSEIRTQYLVYEFHVVVCNVFTIRKPIQYIPLKVDQMVANSIQAETDQHGGPTRMPSSVSAYETMIESNQKAIERLTAVIHRLDEEEDRASKTISDYDELLRKIDDLSEKRKSLRNRLLEYQTENEEYKLRLEKLNTTMEVTKKDLVPLAGNETHLDNKEDSKKQEVSNWKNGQESHQNSSDMSGGRQTVLELFRGDKIYDLFQQNDARGMYYEFTNLKGEKGKFYFEISDAKFEYQLKSLKDFPHWSMRLSRFCERFNMDDITNTDLDLTQTPAQCEITRRVIQDSLPKGYRDCADINLNGQSLYKKIRDEVKESYPRIVKDKMWEEITVDAYCSDLRKLSYTYSDMIYLEIYTEKGNSDRITNEIISNKIRHTLSPNLRMMVDNKYEIKYGMHQDSPINPRDYIETILQVIKYQKESVGVYNETPRGCFNCNSPFHHAENCRKPKKRDPQSFHEESTAKASSLYREKGKRQENSQTNKQEGHHQEKTEKEKHY